jgi:hypothetical protein
MGAQLHGRSESYEMMMQGHEGGFEGKGGEDVISFVGQSPYRARNKNIGSMNLGMREVKQKP